MGTTTFRLPGASQDRALDGIISNQNKQGEVDQSAPIPGSIRMEYSLTASTPSSQPHKLGHPVNGWLVISKDAAAHIYDSGLGDPTYLELTSDVDVNVVILVF